MATPAQPTSSALEQQLAAINDRIRSDKATITALKLKRDKLKKPSAKDFKGMARYAAQKKQYDLQVEKLTKSLAKLSESKATTQNKVWESTGQYGKLLQGTERDAFMALNSLFKTYNLGSLAGKIYDYVKNGYSADTISILLQDSKEYKQRFAGNEARMKAGLPVLNPSEYLATEASYGQIMRAAGLPPGFYDSPSDFNNWIGKNISPSEIQSRVDLATQATVLSNPTYRQALNQMGISDKQLTAYFLDSTRALPHLQAAAATAQVGAEALAQNLRFDVGYAEKLAKQGVSAEEARQGYSQIASEMDTMRALGSMYGDEWTQRSAEQATFEGQAGALQKQRKLVGRERAEFGGAAGTARGGLAGRGGAR